MDYHYKKHYTREEARALLPRIRAWLKQLAGWRDDLARYDRQLAGLMNPGQDLGGELVNNWIRALTSTQEVLMEFQRREIVIQDLDRGLLDFPAIIGGREVFLCWEQDEEDVDHWHDLDAGFGGREPL
jgi:hypothetical protein